jgi:hypothetical protein
MIMIKRSPALFLAAVLLLLLLPPVYAGETAAEPVLSAVVLMPSATSDSAVINLSAETIDLGGFRVRAYSLNGGGKWKKGPLPIGDKFRKLFNKSTALWLSDTWNDSAVKTDGVITAAKGVPDSATLVKFPETERRPKRNADKLKPYYLDSHWILAARNSTDAVFTGYEYAASTNGKTPSEAWRVMPAEGLPIPDKGKPTVLIRTAPSGTGTSVFVPASPHFRIRPRLFRPAPKYKVATRWDKEENQIKTVTLKKGDVYAIDDGDFSEVLTGNLTLNIEELLQSGSFLHIKKAATGKNPPTRIQTINLTAANIATNRVTVTATSTGIPATATSTGFPAASVIRYSRSSATAATTGLVLPAAGFKLPVGQTIFVYAEALHNGVLMTESTSYRAIEADVDKGKVLSFNNLRAPPTFDSAAVSADGKTITVKFPEQVRTAQSNGFVLGGPDAGEFSILSAKVESDAKTVTLTLNGTAWKNADFSINLSSSNAPTTTLNARFAPRTEALKIDTSAVTNTPRMLLSASYNPNHPATITLTFSENVNSAGLTSSGFVVQVNNLNVPLQSAVAVSGNTVTVTLTNTVAQNATLTVNVTQTAANAPKTAAGTAFPPRNRAITLNTSG